MFLLLHHGPPVSGAFLGLSVTQSAAEHLGTYSFPLPLSSEMKGAQSSLVSSSTRQSRVQGSLGQGGQAEDLKRYVTVPSTDLASGWGSGKVP